MAWCVISTPFLAVRAHGGSAAGLRFQASDVGRLSSPSLMKISNRRTCAGRKLVVQAAGNTFGTVFRVTTFGESHGEAVGCVIDGCPPQIPLSEADIQVELDRRRPGQNRMSTPREETDPCRIISGICEGMTTGAPIAVMVPNTGHIVDDYKEMSFAYRPSHADATYDFKYGVRSIEGGGRSSARETVGRVIPGAIAKKILKMLSGMEVLAYVSQVHKVILPVGMVDNETLTLEQVESNMVRCPDPEYAEEMIRAIDDARVRGDSLGGVVTCVVRERPACTFMTGAEHNDEFCLDERHRIQTRTNHSGGIQGGISNGEIINMRVAFKPIGTIAMKQHTVTRDKREIELALRGHHDPCVLPRAVPIVEAMVALVLLDQLMLQRAQGELFPINPILQESVLVPRHDAASLPI